ncbi:hypothetical protein RMCBS344292_07438 [Rhizopus microsporus]|nr:hypothetical protein RMCBS344292_07438 [Rhizopus microsporus]
MTPEEDQFYLKLNQVSVPSEEEIKRIFEISDQEEQKSRYEKALEKILEVIQIGHVLAFEVEENVKLENDSVKSIEPVEAKLEEISNVIELLIELNEIIPGYRLECVKIQSEHSGLQHFIKSIKELQLDLSSKFELQQRMESILLSIDQLSLLIFQFQEQRQKGYTLETLLIEIDNQVGPLFSQVEQVYHQTYTDENLIRKNAMIQEKWENLRLEIDDLKMELKEDRWLAVFKQVADQVEDMMNGLEKTVAQCYHFITRTPQSTCSTSSNDSNSSSSTDKLRSLEKNFEAKFKYYTPSIDKMLTMLGNGIAARVSKDSVTIKRHEAMVHRWDQLKMTMDQLRKRDLFWDRPMSPARSCSRLSAESSSFKSPEPDFYIRSRSPLFTPERSGTPKLMERSGTPSKFERGGTPSKLERVGTPSKFERRDKWLVDRTTKVERSATPIERSATPNKYNYETASVKRSATPNQSATLSSRYREDNISPPRPQSMMTMRRAVTPSLIPRPKTPHEIPRPKSVMTRKVVVEDSRSNKKILTESNRSKSYYKPDPKDELDVQISTIINSSPVTIHCQKSPQGQGKYYFGNELLPSLGGGKKIYTCKLMAYRNKKNKVLIRVGGGWQDLEIFLLEHMNLMGN